VLLLLLRETKTRTDELKTKRSRIDVRGIPVEIVRKNIKNLNLRVYPPDGLVRVSMPYFLDDDIAQMAVTARWDWIRRQQARVRQQSRHPEHQMITGENHYVQGKACRLNVIEQTGHAVVTLGEDATLELQVPVGTSSHQRAAVLDAWYRQRLREQLPALVKRWEPTLGVKVAEFRIKKMKTRWGTCNVAARRVWLNLELAKRPSACLEYVLVHEMVHLLEQSHNQRFWRLMDRFMPQWRLHRAELKGANAAPYTRNS